MGKLYINGYQGGGKNHLRWLLLLSDRFDMTMDPNIPLVTKTQKLMWIKQNIYPKERNWRNWMLYEDRYRYMMDDQIALPSVNEHPLWNDQDPNSKSIVMIVDPYLCEWKNTVFQTHRSAEEGFLYNQKVREQAQKDNRILVLECDALHLPGSLDTNIINLASSWFGLENIYDRANTIHKWWQDLHIIAEQEYLTTVSRILDQHR